MTTFEVFRPKGIVSRILGMGDIVQLVEKVEQHIDEQEAKRLEEKIRKKSFDFNDFLKQLDKLQKMGGLAKILSLLPGGKNLKNAIETKSDEFKKFRGIIDSMTKRERRQEDDLNLSRKQRIAKGCGQSIEKINQFIKKFFTMKEVMSKASSNDMNIMGEALLNNKEISSSGGLGQSVANFFPSSMGENKSKGTKKKVLTKKEKKKKRKQKKKKR